MKDSLVRFVVIFVHANRDPPHFSDNPFLRQFVLPTKLSSLPALPFSPTSYLRLVFFPFFRHIDTSDNPILRQSCYAHISDKIVKPNSPTKYFSQFSDNWNAPTFPKSSICPYLRQPHFVHFSDSFCLHLRQFLEYSFKIPILQQNLTVRDHAQNTTNSAISLVIYNVIPLLIGQPL